MLLWIAARLQAFAQLAMHPMGATGEEVFHGLYRRKLLKANTFALVLRSMQVTRGRRSRGEPRAGSTVAMPRKSHRRESPSRAACRAGRVRL